ncbi:hypothetical protein HJC23_004913 [Cyclotella cryptica]|uniref:RING-type domain-containing protein n=1 Tax=Cyclotella cryptica TaxID=29204 RepID=A0ABD3PT61_9STRA
MISEHFGAPIPINSDEPIPHDLICSICMSLPSDVPVVTPCQHLFCNDCLREALSRQQLCPVDRCPVDRRQVSTLGEGTLIKRIWGSVKVKCANHVHGCAWTGPVADYKSHAESCIHDQQRSNALIQPRIDEIQEELRQTKQLNTDLIQKLSRAKKLLEQKDQKLNTLNTSIAERDPKALGLFHGSYDFGRNDVVRLSQLISARLENKPLYIDSNKIFNCVQACFRDWEAGYRDNPQYYYVDMKMLLATCNASTWFTDNQKERIRIMLRELD